VRTMCGEPGNEQIRKYFDYETRIIVNNGVNTRFIGLPEDIKNELLEAGFEILYSEIDIADIENNQGTLIIYLLKPWPQIN
jgi:hypothetical protein